MSTADPFFSTANLLSLSRIPLGFLFAAVLVTPWGGPRLALTVLALAGLTDALDGRVARQARARRKGSPRGESPAGTGSWLDPICDKVFVATVLGAIWFHSRPSLTLLGLILARELAQLPLSVVYLAVPSLRLWLRYDFRASLVGKAATVSQFVAIAALMFGSPATPLAAGNACIFGLLALVGYIERGIRLGRRRQREAAAQVVGKYRLPVAPVVPDADARPSSSVRRP